jgi:hypothetical protein
MPAGMRRNKIFMSTEQDEHPMSTNDPEFYQAPKFTPEPPQALPRQRGCFFYGCIIALVLALLMAILLAIMAFFTYRFFGKLVDEYTSTVPRDLPKVEMPAEQRQALKDRVEAFRKAVDEGTPTEPLVLTSDDLNALIDENPDLKGLIYVKVEGEEIKGQVSIPLDKLNVGMFRGRYLNGEADLKASLKDGVLIVTLDSIEVNGKRPPEEIMKGIREQNLAKDVYKEEKNANTIRKLESLEVKDGKIILRVRAKAGSTPDSTATKKEARVEIVPPPSDGAAKAEPSKNGETPKVDEGPKAKAQPPAAEVPAPKS